MINPSIIELLDKLNNKIKSASTEQNHVEIISELTTLISSFEYYQSQYYNSLRELERRILVSTPPSFKKAFYSVLFRGLGRDGMSHRVIFRGKRSGASLKGISSFKAAVSMQARRRQLGKFGPETAITNKVIGENFATSFGLRTALAYSDIFTAENIPLEGGTVIKPVGELGSKGVYIIRDENYIYDVQNSDVVTSLDLVRQRILALVNRSNVDQTSHVPGYVKNDSWIVERAIYDYFDPSLPARDLKFYTFYGKVGLVLEILRFPEKRYCWWDTYGKRVKTGKYEDEAFVGKGVSTDEIELVNRISASIPGPFLRIDFLRGTEGLIFGEFSGGVGRFHEFNEEWDSNLGELLLEAEGRVLSDALQGKKYPEFQSLMSEYYGNSISEQQIKFTVETGKFERALLQAIKGLKSKGAKGYSVRSEKARERIVVARCSPEQILDFKSTLNDLQSLNKIRSFTESVSYEPIDYQLAFQIN